MKPEPGQLRCYQYDTYFLLTTTQNNVGLHNQYNCKILDYNTEVFMVGAGVFNSKNSELVEL